MEVGVAGPRGVPVFKERKQGPEHVITRIPVQVESPALERQPKPGSVKMKSWSICGNGPDFCTVTLTQ